MFAGISLDLCAGLFPGQGAYRPGALRDAWLRREGPVPEIFGQIDDIAVRFTGEPLSARIFSASPPVLDDMLAVHPDLLQLAIFGQSVAAFRVMEQGGARFSCLAGHSLGEIGALVCAGAYSVAQGAEIICYRTAAVRQAGATGQMLALGTDQARGQEILHLLGAADVVLAADNGPRQIVLSGPVPDLQRAAAIASVIGVAVTAIRSPAPFHNPVLAPARRELSQRIAGIPRGRLRIPVYSPILSRQYHDTDDLPSLLGLHLVSPVRFGAAVTRLYDAGVRIFVEAGAGSALTGLIAAGHPDVTVLHPLAGPDDRAALAQAIAYLAGPQPAAAGQASPPAWETPSAWQAAPAWETPPAWTPPAWETAPARGAVPAWEAQPQAAAVPPVPPAPPAREAPEAWAAPAARKSAPAAPAAAVVTREEILRAVRTLYAEALEYPEDVLTEDAEFEAHLGVDSLKQTEMFARLGKLYGIDVVPDDVSGIDTIGKAVDFIHASLSSRVT
jgi:[acyl-carrier-protein] S-malonyltransferase